MQNGGLRVANANTFTAVLKYLNYILASNEFIDWVWYLRRLCCYYVYLKRNDVKNDFVLVPLLSVSEYKDI